MLLLLAKMQRLKFSTKMLVHVAKMLENAQIKHLKEHRTSFIKDLINLQITTNQTGRLELQG